MRYFVRCLLAMLLFLPLPALADTITYDAANSANGTYKYSLTIGAATENFSSGTAFTFTGLSGVTGASSLYPYAFAVAYTPTSVSFTFKGDYSTSQTYADIFSIQSSVLNLGSVQYSIPSSTAQTGTVQGPVTAATPEPTSLVLLGTGLLGMTFLLRRRVI